MKKTSLLLSLVAVFYTSEISATTAYIYLKDHKVVDIRKQKEYKHNGKEVVLYQGPSNYANAFGHWEGDCGATILGDVEPKNQAFCDSAFTEVKSYTQEATTRAIMGAISFGVLTVAFGTANTKIFNSNLLSEYLKDSDIAQFEPYITGERNIQIVRKFDIEDYVDGKLMKVTDLLPSTADDVMLFDKESNQWLFVNRTKSAEQLLVDWLSVLLKPRALAPVSLPAMISEPAFPPIVSLTKDEFETKMQFKGRVDKAIKEREKAIADMKVQYGKDIIERNKNLNLLLGQYKKEIVLINKEQDIKKEKMKSIIKHYTKLAFLLSREKSQLINPVYDAEIGMMDVNITINPSFKNKQIAFKQSPENAKEFKSNLSLVKTETVYEMNENVFKLKSIITKYNGSEYIYKASETDFEPEEIKLNFDAEKGFKIVMTSEDESNMFTMQSNNFEQTKLESATSFRNKSSNRKK